MELVDKPGLRSNRAIDLVGAREDELGIWGTHDPKMLEEGYRRVEVDLEVSIRIID